MYSLGCETVCRVPSVLCAYVNFSDSICWHDVHSIAYSSWFLILANILVVVCDDRRVTSEVCILNNNFVSDFISHCVVNLWCRSVMAVICRSLRYWHLAFCRAISNARGLSDGFMVLWWLVSTLKYKRLLRSFVNKLLNILSLYQTNIILFWQGSTSVLLTICLLSRWRLWIRLLVRMRLCLRLFVSELT